MDEAGQISIAAELARKGIHLLALSIPVGYFFVPFPIAIYLILFSASVSLIIDISRFKGWPLWNYLSKIMGPIYREHEKKGGLSGATYILSTAALVILLYPKTIAIAAMVFIIIGDTVAALVGRKFGKHRLIGNKTLEGSSACLMSLILVSFLIPGLPFLSGLAGAFVASITELFSGKIDDNLTVPLISGAVMLIVMRLLGYEQAVLFSAILSP